MNKQTLVTGLIALALVGAVVGGILYSTRHNKVEVTAEILKVRSHQIDPSSTIVAIDFRVHNPSTQQFVVRDVEVVLETKDGKPVNGDIFSEIDAQRMFEYYKVLGPKHNATLVRREKVNSGQSIDRMIAARLAVTDVSVQERKAIRLIIHDIDGATSDIVEVRGAR
jgi:hypothetical protein